MSIYHAYDVVLEDKYHIMHRICIDNHMYNYISYISSVCYVRDDLNQGKLSNPRNYHRADSRRPWRLQLLPTSIQGIGLHVFSDGFRSPNPYDVHSGLANSLRMKNGWEVLMYIAWVEVFEGTRNINVKPII